MLSAPLTTEITISTTRGLRRSLAFLLRTVEISLERGLVHDYRFGWSGGTYRVCSCQKEDLLGFKRNIAVTIQNLRKLPDNIDAHLDYMNSIDYELQYAAHRHNVKCRMYDPATDPDKMQ